jgi:DNA repair protein RecN (Recombination protein N)
VDSLEADPGALEQVVERLFRIGDLKRKYGDSVGEVLAYADTARERLMEVERRSARQDELLVRAEGLAAQLDAAATALSARRQAAAARLATAVQHELHDLRLAESSFTVGVEAVPVDGTGADRVEFRLGDDRRAMARVASGGELARIALALKTVLSHAETRPTLIFDEVDVGVGGRTAPVVGQKLWSVAAAGHQVLCVTHLPQVAAFADSHYAVSRTSAEVCAAEVSGEQRVDELAAMLAGTVSEAARQSARELLARANAAKANVSS